ncbi:radical SAM protein [Ghiorsea bivora]|uniref:radical SAM protein n=1 Tax=Ghiorsea bivora TaxID=1485545 RepID=UPI000570B180|nr:radical SAM protein [Ghiorsea bivora]
MLPHYIFLVEGQFVRCISDVESKSVTLIHAFDEAKQLVLNGSFAEALIQQLNTPNPATSNILQVIEKQHGWLTGLSKASLMPADFQQLVIGDELGLLFLEITDQCNEQCIHCYASSSPACSDFLSLHEIKSILEQARCLGTPFVQFTGGDPLIHRNLVEVVAYAHELGFEGMEIYTNGLLLNEKLLEQLLPYQPKIAFSLYSPDEAVHDGITQVKGSFKKTVAAIHRAQDMAFQVRIGMAVMQQNAGHEQAMLDFVQETFYLDKSHVRFDPVHETGRGASLSTKNISLMPSQNSHMPESTKKPAHHQVVQTDKIESGFVSQHIGRRGKLAVCANGDVSPCIFNREHVLGNIRQQTFQEMFAVKNKGLGNKNPNIERWNNCQHQLSCGDCQMVAYTLGAHDE